MHSALYIVELLFRIFDDPILASQPIGEEDDYPTNHDHYLRRHPLLSLALSCKTLSPVALHVLWREIGGIDQLLWTMSNDIIRITIPVRAEEREESGSEGSSSFYSSQYELPRKCMTFKKQPIEQDWEPFDRYGALVTRLKNRNSFALGDLLELSRSVLEALSARYDLRGTSLLPNLQSLTCLGQQLQYGHTLLGPRLRSLLIPDTPYYDPDDLQAFLQLARSNPPTRLDLLELSSLRTSGADKKIDQLFSELVINIQQKGEGLRRVYTRFFSWFSLEALNLVLTNERTRDVQVGVEQFDLDRVLPPGTSGSRKNLHTVMIYAAKGVTSDSLFDQFFFQKLLRRLDARDLVCFTFLCGPKYLSVHDARTIFTSFHYEKAFSDDNTNQSSPMIRISPTEPSNGITIDLTHYICTFANSFYLTCQPISSTDSTPRFAYLDKLDLNVLVDLTDSDIGSLSSSMPRLTQFNVETSRAGRTGRSRTTLVGIWLLAKNCPAIESVGIWFNAVLDWGQFSAITQLDEDSVSDGEGRRAALQKAMNLNLLFVAVGDSSVEDTDVVAEFFHVVCPRLEHFRMIGEEDWPGWEAVQLLVIGDSEDESSSFVSESSDYGDSDSSDDEWD